LIELKNYQIIAVERLNQNFEQMNKTSDPDPCILDAPTGSGKTVIMAEFLKKLVEEHSDIRFSFIWIAPRKLHDQSKEKLEDQYTNGELKCSDYDDLVDKKIGVNEILFINWERVNRIDQNIYVLPNELNNNLTNIVKNTKDENNKVILIIDESHYAAKGAKSQEVIDMISPDLTFEMSATPERRSKFVVPITLEDVQAAGMIKKEVQINPHFSRLKIDKDTVHDEKILEQAIKKRDDLKLRFKNEGVNINPLILIQLPDAQKEMVNMKVKIQTILEKTFKKTVENGEVAIWLSEEKEELENIVKYESKVEVLLFKQAISIGWDCPRASILVIFRKLKDWEFTIQTIGRIMRMPEQKHYQTEEELNKGYIFTNLKDVKIVGEYVKDFLTKLYSYRDNKNYKPVTLKSYWLEYEESTRKPLSGEFIKIFNQSANIKKIKSTATKNPKEIPKSIISDGKIVNIDKKGQVLTRGMINVKNNEEELIELLDNFIYEACSGYTPTGTMNIIKEALYQSIKAAFGFNKYGEKARNVILGGKNQQFFFDMITVTKRLFKDQDKSNKKITHDKIWEVLEEDSFKSTDVEWPEKKSIMKPFYSKTPTGPEQEFMKILDSDSKKGINNL